MKIYFVLEYVGGKGGVETVVTRVTRALEAEGHDVQVFLPKASGDPAWEARLPAAPIYYCKSSRPGQSRVEALSDRCIGLTYSMAQMSPPDLVVATHVPQTAYYARAAVGMSKRTPVISWLHNPPEMFLEPESVNYADIHWAISHGIANKVAALIENQGGIHWVGNPVELDVASIPLSSKPQYIYVGRLENKQKRLDVMLRGLANAQSECMLDIYGTGPDESALKDLARSLGLQDKVRFHGWVSNVWKQISEATAVLLSSDFEGMPMVIGEAMARGLPVISTDCETGPADLIEHGVNGWLYPVRGEAELGQLLDLVSGLEPEQLQSISAAAKASIRQHGMDRVIGRMKHSLLNLIPRDRWNT